MKYLSDPIVINYSSVAGTYVTFNVFSRYPRTSYSSTPIYTGRLYCETSETKHLYLNDIIKIYCGNPEAFKPDYDGGIPTPSNIKPTRILQKFKVSFSTGDDIQTDWVLCYNKDVNLPDGPMKSSNFDPEANVVDAGYDLLAERSNLLPRLPRLATATKNLWFACTVIPNTHVVANSEVDGDPVYVVSNNTTAGDNTHVFDDPSRLWGDIYIYNYDNIDSYLYDLTRGGDNIYVKQYAESNEGEVWSVKVATVDTCPADYYLIWMDRTGGYQCQPFTKNTSYSENITSQNKINAVEEETPYLKTITSNWTLRSDWMTDSQYKVFESILTSPYLYLYDVKNDIGNWVNCTDTSWSEKTYKNQKKLFNLTVNLKSMKNQYIEY